MAISLGFGPADLARCRFAVSPAFETLAAVRDATGPQGPGHHRRWLEGVRSAVPGLGLEPIVLLQPRRGYTPDFLAPPPTAPVGDFDAELTRIAATPAPVVRREIELSLSYTAGARESAAGRLLLGDPAEVLSLLTQLIRGAWETLVAPYWPQVRAVLEADVAYQSRRLAEGGLDRLFTDLHPTVHWTGDTLIRDPGGDEHHDLDGRGLLLMPSVFKWEEVVVITDPPWQPTLIYPARGLGNAWEPRPDTTAAALTKLIGRTRAHLLTGLDEPASTTRLAHRHALALGTVSEHLAVLRDAGMVVGERHRHEIRYRRTGLGDAVVRGR
ncbi:MAG: winged helix-turn-helix transcriptional regulator [Catenulispora sp.]|nr:winged helix-turn-helix transcriptional regulator [Catenulispora sp.]